MNPFLLLVWSVFALLVMSPVGYWATRGVRRWRLRHRFRELHEPLALPPGSDPEIGPVLQCTLALREQLRQPILETQDYLAALPVLEIAVHLSRQLRRRNSWGMRMQQRFQRSVQDAFEAVEQWCLFIEAQDDDQRDVLVHLGLDATPVRHLVMEHRASTAGWAGDFGTAEDARLTAGRLERIARCLDGFARALIEGRAHPYR